MRVDGPCAGWRIRATGTVHARQVPATAEPPPDGVRQAETAMAGTDVLVRRLTPAPGEEIPCDRSTAAGGLRVLPSGAPRSERRGLDG